MPESVANIPAQPNAPQYPIAALNLYRSFDRASYEAQFGVQPPRYDAAKPVKKWFATDAAQFKVYNEDSKRIETLQLDAKSAAAVNLPGLYRYPEYVAPQNSATAQFLSSSITIADGFVRLADAQALADSLGGTVEATAPAFGGTFVYALPDSKLYNIRLEGSSIAAATLLLTFYQRGVGHPGTWRTQGAIPVFTPSPDYDGPQANSPPGVRDPIRDLLPGETLQFGLMGMLVARADKVVVSPAGGSFTDADRKLLQDVHTMLGLLLGALKLV